MKLIQEVRRNRTQKRQGRARKGEGTLRLRGTVYWYRIPNPIPGRPPLEGSCGTSDHREAVIVKTQAILDAQRPKTGNEVQLADIGELIEDYWGERELSFRQKEKDEPDYDPKPAISSLRSTLNQLKKFFGHMVADSLTSDDTIRYRRQREVKDGIAFTTTNLELRYLRVVLNRAISLTPPKASRVPRMWFPSEKSRVHEGFIERGSGYEEILAELPDSLKALFVCAFHVGGRGGEMKKLRWDMVDWTRRVITLRGKTTKNSDTRNIPIWGDMMQWLTWQKGIRDRDFPACPHVFFYHLNAKGSHGSRVKNTTRVFKAAAVRAGFPKIRFHDTRRSAIRYAVQDARMDSTVVRHMSGHKDPKVFDRYNIGSTREMEDLGRGLDEALRKTGKGKAKVVQMRKAG